jgi:hydroxymethylpyrimidine pyrophosphatase-like HAD family hydrolase
VRCLYVDLDGTLLGPGGAIVHDAEKRFTLAGLRAVEACARAGAEVVIMTGRGKTSASEDARLLAQTSFIFEIGSCFVIEGEEHWLTGDLKPGTLSIHDQIDDSGAPALLLEHYAGRLEYHEPWHRNREVSHLFRGLVDAFEADELLAANGHEGLRLVDNGTVHRRSAALADLPQVRGYHLLPRGASKAGGVAAHMRARGYAPEDCIAVGDSREDLQVASVLGAFWLVANAVEKDPTIREALGDHRNARVCEHSHGAGVYEAVVTTLAERR